MRIVAFTTTLLLMSGCSSEKPQSEIAIALSVPDGESIAVNISGREQRIWLCGISAERSPKEAKRYIQSLVKPDTWLF